MRIAILGGTGYLGGRLIRALIASGHSVVCIHRETSNLAQFDDVKAHVAFCLCDPTALNRCFAMEDGVDCVINASCSYEVPGNSIGDVIASNLCAPLELLNLAFDAKTPLFISIGSGLPRDLNAYTICKEQFNTFGKYFTLRAPLLNRQGGFRFIDVALENYYGPGEPETRFLPSVIRKLRANEDVLLTEGLQHRDFIHIDDVIRTLVRLLNVPKDWPNYVDVPVGTGQAPTIREIIEYLAEFTGSSSRLLFGAIPMRPNEPSCVADTSVMRRLGVEAQLDWRTGLSKLLEEME